MSRAWRKLNRKVQIDQRRYYLWMIAVLIGIPVNFIFSGWGEDELACTFAHFSSTWFMWVEYKTPSPLPLPTPLTLPPSPFIRNTYMHARPHICTRGSKLLPLSCISTGAVYVSAALCRLVAAGEIVVYLHARACFSLCVCLYEHTRLR